MANLFQGAIGAFIGLIVCVLTQYTFGELMNNTFYNWAAYYTAGTNLASIPGNVLMFYNLFFQLLLFFLIAYPVIVVLKRQDDRWRPI